MPSNAWPSGNADLPSIEGLAQSNPRFFLATLATAAGAALPASSREQARKRGEGGEGGCMSDIPTRLDDLLLFVTDTNLSARATFHEPFCSRHRGRKAVARRHGPFCCDCSQKLGKCSVAVEQL